MTFVGLFKGKIPTSTKMYHTSNFNYKVTVELGEISFLTYDSIDYLELQLWLYMYVSTYININLQIKYLHVYTKWNVLEEQYNICQDE